MPNTAAGIVERRVDELLDVWRGRGANGLVAPGFRTLGMAPSLDDPPARALSVAAVVERSATRVAVRLAGEDGEGWWVAVDVEPAPPHRLLRAVRLPVAGPGPDGVSATALSAAAARAMHVVADRPPHVFADHLAVLLLPTAVAAALPVAPRSGGHPLAVVVRARVAEDAVEAAYRRGCRQYVVLGAGLDTFAYRRRDLPGLRVFEVDRPAMQAWKRQRLAEAGIDVPDGVAFVGVDFEGAALGDALAAAGCRTDEPAVFSWLGVVGYLTRPAVEETLRAMAAMGPGTEVVLDYWDPDLEDELDALLRDLLSLTDEPIVSVFTRQEMHALLASCGLSPVDDVDPVVANDRYLDGHPDALTSTGCFGVTHAVVPGSARR